MRPAKFIYCTLLLACVGLLLHIERPSVKAKGGLESASTVAATRFVSDPPVYESNFIDSVGVTPSVHSGTLAQLSDGRILSAWFGGAREGARDVRILMSTLDSGESDWSEPVVIASREQTAEDLNRHVEKLGNPILFSDSRGRVWLFYVAVSFGGWSGSSITVRYSDDLGTTWSESERLVTSPFLNISTLLKGAPIQCDAGHLHLPVYHEFLRKFGELLTLCPEGKMVSKTRLTASHGAIQPYVVAVDADAARVFYRQNGYPVRKVLTQSFSDLFAADNAPLQCTNLDNPNASVAVVLRNRDGFLMVCNPLDQGRHKLSLAISDDGVQWRVIHDIEDGQSKGEFSYPYLIRGESGNYHLIYTWNRIRMRYVTFNDAWLEGLE